MIKQRLVPPLPFLGNKRNYIKTILSELEIARLYGVINKDTIFIDLFGGSGLISHNIKALFGANRVIWNDYDNYKERLDNIHLTEQIRLKILEIGFNIFITRWNIKLFHKKYGNTSIRPFFDYQIDHIKRFLKQKHDNNEYLDLITISSWLIYGGRYAKDINEILNCKTFYSRDINKPLTAEGYLEGVERVSCDWEELAKEYESDFNVIWIIDPPYIGTYGGHYNNNNNILQFLKDKRFIFFNSNWDKVVELAPPPSILNAKRIDKMLVIGNNLIKDENKKKRDFMLHNLH